MPSGVLGEDEHVVPEPGLQVALHLRQVEVRAASAVDLRLAGVQEVEREVEEAAGDRLAVDQHVLLRQVPAARPDHGRRRGPSFERVLLAVGLRERQRPVDRVPQVGLPGEHVLEQRRVGVLEVGQPDLGAGVQRVDRHLRVGRPGDLDPAVLEPGRGRRDLPVGPRGRPWSPAGSPACRRRRARPTALARCSSSSARRARTPGAGRRRSSSASGVRIRSSRPGSDRSLGSTVTRTPGGRSTVASLPDRGSFLACCGSRFAT